MNTNQVLDLLQEKYKDITKKLDFTQLSIPDKEIYYIINILTKTNVAIPNIINIIYKYNTTRLDIDWTSDFFTEKDLILQHLKSAISLCEIDTLILSERQRNFLY
jgi:hypothetical protein